MKSREKMFPANAMGVKWDRRGPAQNKMQGPLFKQYEFQDGDSWALKPRMGPVWLHRLYTMRLMLERGVRAWGTKSLWGEEWAAEAEGVWKADRYQLQVLQGPKSSLLHSPQIITKELLCKSGCYVSTLLCATRKTKKIVFALKELTNNSTI